MEGRWLGALLPEEAVAGGANGWLAGTRAKSPKLGRGPWASSIIVARASIASGWTALPSEAVEEASVLVLVSEPTEVDRNLWCTGCTVPVYTGATAPCCEPSTPSCCRLGRPRGWGCCAHPTFVVYGAHRWEEH